jgi:hypothetical protein
MVAPCRSAALSSARIVNMTGPDGMNLTTLNGEKVGQRGWAQLSGNAGNPRPALRLQLQLQLQLVRLECCRQASSASAARPLAPQCAVAHARTGPEQLPNLVRAGAGHCV